MKPIRATFQTMTTIVEFSDGSTAVVSHTYDSLTGELIRRPNDTTNEEQRAALRAAPPMKIITTSPFTRHGEW